MQRQTLVDVCGVEMCTVFDAIKYIHSNEYKCYFASLRVSERVYLFYCKRFLNRDLKREKN
jgi:hypothetical protein